MDFEDSIVDLLLQLRAGDGDAAHQLWDRFFANLCMVARGHLPRATKIADEEDIALSAFASVCKRLQRGDYPDLRQRDDFWRLLVTVTERKAFGLLRSEQRHKRGGGKLRGESVFGGLDQSSPPGIDAIASAEPTPLFVVEMAETVRRMFAALDEQSQRIVLLRLEGERNEDIAQMLGRSVATVERKLKKVRTIWTNLDEVPSN
jgi:RNA polymerase sigma factor (sigma-70 family)